MNRFVIQTVFLGIAGLCTAGLQAAEPTPRLEALQKSARGFIQNLSKGDYETAGANFDEAMRKALPTEKLEATWKAVQAQAGAFSKLVLTRHERSGKYDIVFVTCSFANANLDAKIVYSSDDKITGLFFVPTRDTVAYQPPDYVRKLAFVEKEIQFGLGQWILPGALSLPIGNGPFPVVVLVHGSGPQDRDESLPGNKIFRDLAWGLASRNIAVLRYDKRTMVHASKMAKAKNEITIKEEVLDDVAQAIAFLRGADKIDPKKIFVLGHSLGATLVPKIGASETDLAGLIALAGATRPLEDLILEQMLYLHDKDESKAWPEELDTLKQQIARVKDPKLSNETPAKDLPLGIPAAYWLSLRGYDPAQTAKQLKQPILILQGERDYQVTLVDFAIWKKACGANQNVSLKSYPALNHMFLEGKGRSLPAEYTTTKHVPLEVIEDIAAWIGKR